MLRAGLNSKQNNPGGPLHRGPAAETGHADADPDNLRVVALRGATLSHPYITR